MGLIIKLKLTSKNPNYPATESFSTVTEEVSLSYNVDFKIKEIIKITLDVENTVVNFKVLDIKKSMNLLTNSTVIEYSLSSIGVKQ